MLMQKARNALSWLLFFAILAGIAWLLSHLASVVTGLKLDQPTTQYLITALIGIATFIYGKQTEQNQAMKLELRKEKARVYARFVNWWMATLRRSKDATSGTSPLTPDEQSAQGKEMYEIATELVLWGSNGVV